MRNLSSLQDGLGSRSVTGGAPVGDHRLPSGILPGLIAGISTWHLSAHDFTLNQISVIVEQFSMAPVSRLLQADGFPDGV
jgi:hypothetical protein